MHGWLILDKPVGLGSTGAVSAVKRALRDGGYPKAKVGHGGTLDPLASGVLPVALGEATKLAGRMLNSDKGYDFTIRFGAETSTLDAEGEVVATSERLPTRGEVEAVLARFTGPIEQVPPAYSALKVDGRRAYDLARAGAEVVLKSRSVTVRRLGVVDPGGSARPLHQPLAGPPPRSGEELERVTLSALVSKGTYVRSLARDIAYALDTVGHVTMLRRTRAGPFGLDAAISLDILSEAAKARGLEKALLPLTAGLDDIPALPVDPDQARLLRQGRALIGTNRTQGLMLAIEADTPVALVEASGGEIRVVRGFNL
jgi:tRNA pseudouridine55 synthase